ncbi:hypothetical protein ACCO45_007020 [Purpureocillium lilacinum]|uniref:Uncharacterized protein n=1 Tax=Purpureocillium lilacinum TaxID=33203 RepID=A0ACC4DRX6_PURLI
MSLSDHPKAYGSAALAAAFAAGILVTLGFKDFYPDLEQWYQSNKDSSRRRRRAAAAGPGRRRSSFFWGGGAPVQLEDREAEQDPSPTAAALSTSGRDPLLSAATGRTILAKAEFLNGAGNSPKDRVALSMIEEAERRGLLRPGRGDTIYEGTVGSTGISLATLARARGYRAHICMPDDQALEKSDLLHHLGADVERVPVAPITSPGHFVNLARTRAAEHERRAADGSRGFFANQFESEANWHAHFSTTGPEIWAQTDGGGSTRLSPARAPAAPSRASRATSSSRPSSTGCASGLYNKIRHGVMYSSTEREGTRRRQQVDSIVEGIGINRVTENLEAGRDLIDDAVKVSDEQACRMARWLVENDGIFVGSSSSVNCVAAVQAAMALPEGSRVVTILCDSGTRHLSKFWKRIKEMGLEEEEATNLFQELGISQPSSQ